MAKVTDVQQEARVSVGLDFGTTFSGFAYALITEPKKIYTFYDYPMAGGKPYCKTLTSSYYKQQSGAPGGWQLKSWGYPARAEYERDFHAVRKYRVNPEAPAEDPLRPTLGVYMTRFKLHLAERHAGPSSANALPPGLTVERIVTDYLRALGGLILETLRRHYPDSDITKGAIQWCVTVPSIWDNAAKQQMKNCMIGAGLVDGVDGSPHPLIIVLEPEAASFHCRNNMSEQILEVGDRLLVADIGGGTADIVVQEVVSSGANYTVKEVTTSSGGLCGGTYVDVNFVEFLHRKIGPCLQESFRRNPPIYSLLIKRWEQIKVGFGDILLSDIGDSADIDLPDNLITDWEAYDRSMGIPEKPSYDEVMISYSEMQSIFDPVVHQNLDLISRQLDQACGVKVMVVVGGFSESQYLVDSIKRRFSSQVPHIISPPNPGSAVCQGAVALALNPGVITSRMARKTYGVLCTRPFEEGSDPFEYKEYVDGVAVCNNRFSVYVAKDTPLAVDGCVSKKLRPVYSGQPSMVFELFSSTETNPRYTIGDSVTKEGEVEIDISGDSDLDKERQVELSLFFGRSSLEVKAKALNFQPVGSQQMDLPVKIGYL